MPQARTLPDLMQALRGFQESRVLLTALELDLLTPCQELRSAGEVAAAAGTEPRATAMLLNALAALGVLAKEGERFRCTEAGRALGAGRDGLMHMVHLWDSWSGLSECVRGGGSGRQGPHAAQVESFIAAMATHAQAVTGAAVRLIGAEGVHRLLDVGGGPASFAIAFAQANPELRAEVLDQPAVVPIARRHIAAAGLDARVTAREGDLRRDRFGAGYDLILVSAICHMLGEAENQDLLERCARALAPGGRVAIREFILDPDRAGPPQAALFALNMLVNTERGNTYTEAEYRAWLERAGCRRVVRPEAGGDWIIGQV